MAMAFFETQRDKIVSVLAETDRSGHTEHFAPVRLTSATTPGALFSGRVIGCAGEFLLAEAA
jgi:threonylcarbamoyladenosine tRNA methylthiotransferase MtaB